MKGPELPSGEICAVEVAADEELAPDELAPDEPRTLARYLVYLGAAYLEAERVVAGSASTEGAFDALHRLYGAAGGRAAVLRFHYAEAARRFAEEQRAAAAHDRMAGAYERLVERMHDEIALREERSANLRAALSG